MATVIKAWMATPPNEPECRLQIAVVACNGGAHYHLYNTKELRYETLDDADAALTASMLQASFLYGEGGVLAWDDDTDTYDDNNIVRGEN